MLGGAVARAAAAVTHENIVTVHAVDQSGKIPYLVMEYVDGVSLEERIRSQGRLEPREVVRTGLQVAAGRAAAHSRKLIHRDIKPGNILLEKKTGRAKISDFGLARVVDKSDVARPELLAGTPESMAPAQARADRARLRTRRHRRRPAARPGRRACPAGGGAGRALRR